MHKKLNISDKLKDHRQITFALSWAIDWKKADVNSCQQLYTFVIALQKKKKKAYQIDGVKI